MKIIGAGFGRTGTMSLQAALDQLGFGPCYHMLEVFKHPAHIQTWLKASEGKDVDWNDFLVGYQSGLDYPIVAFYKELLEVFPEAKVILTIRDPDNWYESTLETIYKGTAIPNWILQLIPAFRGMKKMVQETTWNHLFDNRFEEKEYAISVFKNHVEEVKNYVPSERLLVFSVREGWRPLCRFLGEPVPENDFPHINDRKTTQRLYAAARIIPAVLLLSLLMVLVKFL